MPALVIVAHGSHLNPDSARPTFDHADTIRDAEAFDEVRTGFWKEEPSLREVLRTVVADEVFVVPMFISEGYFTEQVVPRELRLVGWDVADWRSDGTNADAVTVSAADMKDTMVHYCGPVGTHDTMTDVVVRRAEMITSDPNVGPGFGLAIVGHGTERNANSAEATHYHADRIRQTNRFDEVKAVFMDEEPVVNDVTTDLDSEDVIIVPLFVADGYHTQEDIPKDVGLTGKHRTGYDVPAMVDGCRVWYAGAVGTEDLMADVILERARDAGADIGDAINTVREQTSVPGD